MASRLVTNICKFQHIRSRYDIICKKLSTTHLHFCKETATVEKIDGFHPDLKGHSNEVFSTTKVYYNSIALPTLVRYLITNKSVVHDREEEELFESLVKGLNVAVDNEYQYIYHNLKDLFESVNEVVRDASHESELQRRDSEFWLMQRISRILERDGFSELSPFDIEQSIRNNKTKEGLVADVDIKEYEYLRFWVSSKKQSFVTLPLLRRLKLKFQPSDVRQDVYQRVVVASKLAKSETITLKLYKDIACKELPRVLPNVKLLTSEMSKFFLATSYVIGSFGVLSKVVIDLANVEYQWPIAVILGAAGTGGYTYLRYLRKQVAFYTDASKVLYENSIAINKGFVITLTDQLKDEAFKDCLLAYAFLLQQKDASGLQFISVDDLKKEVVQWLFSVSGCQFEYHAEDALDLLSKLGLLRRESGHRVCAVPLDVALHNLPATRQFKDQIIVKWPEEKVQVIN